MPWTSIIEASYVLQYTKDSMAFNIWIIGFLWKSILGNHKL